MNERHPAALAENAARVIPDGRLAPVSLSSTLEAPFAASDATRGALALVRREGVVSGVSG